MNEKLILEPQSYSQNGEPTAEYLKIALWLKKLRFRRKIFGGVCEQDAWKKIDELNAMYEDALTAERIRYDALIEHYRKFSVVVSHEDIAADGK